MRPLLFTDFDDVICLNGPYGCFDVAQPTWPADLASRLWHPPALEVLELLVAQFEPQLVVTSSWLRVMTLDRIEKLFRQTGVSWLADALHPKGEALQKSTMSRLDSVDAWLGSHHLGESYVIVDDPLSGTGLAGSKHDLAGRVVLCEVEVGLLPVHAGRIGWALGTALQ
jgi:hypothetical protein